MKRKQMSLFSSFIQQHNPMEMNEVERNASNLDRSWSE